MEFPKGPAKDVFILRNSEISLWGLRVTGSLEGLGFRVSRVELGLGWGLRCRGVKR